MSRSTRLRLADDFAVGALLLATIAAAAGLFSGVYRDGSAMVEQARTVDVATLFVGVPLLAVGLRRARDGSFAGRVVALGVLGYLAYTYAIASFVVVINALTPVYIAILGLATWSLLTIVPWLDLDRLDPTVGARLPRRTTGGFLIASAAAFAFLWLGQIGGAVLSGVPPASVSELGLPTTPVYALDLAFALPLTALGGFLVLRRHPAGPAMALSLLVLFLLITLGMLALFGYQVTVGKAVEPVVLGAFVVMVGIQVVLLAVGLAPARAHGLHVAPTSP
jgi:hypothetical protein